MLFGLLLRRVSDCSLIVIRRRQLAMVREIGAKKACLDSFWIDLVKARTVQSEGLARHQLLNLAPDDDVRATCVEETTANSLLATAFATARLANIDDIRRTADSGKGTRAPKNINTVPITDRSNALFQRGELSGEIRPILPMKLRAALVKLSTHDQRLARGGRPRNPSEAGTPDGSNAGPTPCPSAPRALLMFGPESARQQCRLGIRNYSIAEVFKAMDVKREGRWLINLMLAVAQT